LRARVSGLSFSGMWRSNRLHTESRVMRVFRRVNVRDGERVMSVAAGVALLALARRRWASRALALVAAGMLLRRGITGKCPVYKRLGLSSL
jgi:hypothetical protein